MFSGLNEQVCSVMAASAVKGPPYLQVGPRQGVYCRPSVVLTTWPSGGYQQQLMRHPQQQQQQQCTSTGGGRLKWRLSQFRSPDHNYRLRARADVEGAAQDDNIPQIPGKVIERPSSAVSCETKMAKAPPPKLQVSRSSCGLLHINSQSRGQHTQQLSGKPARPSSATRVQGSHRRTITAPVFSIQACAVTIQSRPPVRSFSTPRKIAPPEEPFPYPDPVQVGGDLSFNVRLTELARLQRETVKNEELRARIARRNAGAMATSSSATNLQATRQPPRPSSSVARSSVPGRTGLSRKTSLPVPTVEESQPPPSSTLEHSVNSRKLPVPAKPSSDDSSTAITENVYDHNTVEQRGIEIGSLTTGSKCESVKHQTTTVDAEQSGIEKKDEVQVCAESKTVVVSEVLPKTHHRELVNAIFSRENHLSQNHAEDMGTGSTSMTYHSENGSQTGSVRIEKSVSPKHSGDSNTMATSQPLLQVQESPNAHTNKSTSEVSSCSNSSVSSSSISSERNSSPTHNSGKKSQVKPSKTRKHTKKTGRHKHT